MLPRRFFISLLTFLLLVVPQVPQARIYNPNRSHFVFSSDGKYLAKVFHTENETWVKIHDTRDMSTVAEWKIQDFRPHTIEFAPYDSSKLLLADRKKLLVYHLVGNHNELLFVQPEIRGRDLVSASFGVNGNSIIWATKNNVINSPLDSNTEQKLAAFRPGDGTIRSILPINADKYAVIFDKNPVVYIYSRNNTIFADELKGHQLPVIGIQTPDGRLLFTIDEHQELIIWDLKTKNIVRKLRLGDLENPSKVEAFSLDSNKTNLLVQTQADPDNSGTSYSVYDLSRGIVKPSKVSMSTTDTGNIYSTAEEFKNPGNKPTTANGQVTTSRPSVSYSSGPDKESVPAKKNSYYDLAKIEADNENYDAALGFIKKVSPNDPNYRASRELRKKVLDEIEVRNSLEGAVEQFRTGNYESAKILLENLLAKNPENKTVKRYLDLTEAKLSSGVLNFLIVLLVILIAAGGIGIGVWKYRPDLFEKLVPLKKKTKDDESDDDSAYLKRKAFILKLDETRKMLKKAIFLDRDGRYKDKWLEFNTTLNDIEKRARQDDKYLPGLIEHLEKLQRKILKIAPAAKPRSKSKPRPDVKTEHMNEKSTGDSESPKTESEQKTEEQKESTPEDESKKKNTKPDYYRILGVTEKASLDDIKKAYRQKMQEYHPDKHNASDFNWVKEEASRMTRLIQEAYEALTSQKI